MLLLDLRSTSCHQEFGIIGSISKSLEHFCLTTLGGGVKVSQSDFLYVKIVKGSTTPTTTSVTLRYYV